MQALAGSLVVLVVFAFIVAATVRLRKGRRPGNAAVGAYQELLIEDKRKAMEVIVEGRAERRDLTKPGDGDPDAEG